MFTNFLVETAKAVTTIGARAPQLTDLIENANTTFTGDRRRSRRSFAAGPAKSCRSRCTQGNKTFDELPVDASTR